MKRSSNTREKTISFDEIRKIKARDRKRDWDRIARGEVTPEEVQKENSIFEDAADYVFLNISDVAKAIRRRLRHSKVKV